MVLMLAAMGNERKNQSFPVLIVGPDPKASKQVSLNQFVLASEKVPP